MKPALYAFAAILLIGGGVVALQSSDSSPEGGSDTVASQPLGREKSEDTDLINDTTTTDLDEQDPAQSEAPDSSPAATQNTGTYVDYEGVQTIADAADTKRVLFFHASWCPTCNAFEDDILDQGVPAGVTMIQANFDDDTELKQQYGVTVQSTFVLLDESGNAVETWPFGRGLSGIGDLYSQI